MFFPIWLESWVVRRNQFLELISDWGRSNEAGPFPQSTSPSLPSPEALARENQTWGHSIRIAAVLSKPFSGHLRLQRRPRKTVGNITLYHHLNSVFVRFRLWLKEKEENVQSLSFLFFRNVSLERCLGICLLLALDLLLTITSPTDQSLDSSRRAFPKDASSSRKRRLGVATKKKTQSEHQPPRMGLNMLIICNV